LSRDREADEMVQWTISSGEPFGSRSVRWRYRTPPSARSRAHGGRNPDDL